MRLSRRTFLAGAGAVSWRSAAKAQSFQAMVHCALEWTLTSAKSYGNPFTDVELDVIVRDPEGGEVRGAHLAHRFERRGEFRTSRTARNHRFHSVPGIQPALPSRAGARGERP